MPQLNGLTASEQVVYGIHPDISYVSVFGYNPDVDATAASEDIWNGGGVYTGFPEETETLTITSSSDEDTLTTGTGAWTLRLFGRDANYNTVIESINLDGTSGVTTVNQFHRLSFAQVRLSGSAQRNVGTITMRHTSTTDNIFAIMPVGESRTKLGVYTVPANRSAIFKVYRGSVSNSTGSAARARLSIQTKEPATNTWEEKRSVWLKTTASTSEVRLEGGILLPTGTDVVARIREGASADNLAVSASYELFVIRD
jgi:hypothetical protein